MLMIHPRGNIYTRCRVLHADGEYIWMNHCSLNEALLTPKSNILNALYLSSAPRSPPTHHHHHPVSLSFSLNSYHPHSLLCSSIQTTLISAESFISWALFRYFPLLVFSIASWEFSRSLSSWQEQTSVNSTDMLVFSMWRGCELMTSPLTLSLCFLLYWWETRGLSCDLHYDQPVWAAWWQLTDQVAVAVAVHALLMGRPGVYECTLHHLLVLCGSCSCLLFQVFGFCFFFYCREKKISSLHWSINES